MEINKGEVIQAGLKVLELKISQLQAQLQELEESLASETKSSVGDKHETARARMQAEQEKIDVQLRLAKMQMQELEKHSRLECTSVVGQGSLVHCNRGVFFVGPAVGKIRAAESDVYFISPQSPLGTALSGRLKGDVVKVNGTEYQLLNVL